MSAMTPVDPTMLTSALARLISQTQLARVPADVVAWASRAIADTIGCGLAGASEESVMRLREIMPTSSGPSLVFGGRERMHPLDAAQINGAAAHALDFDDCHIVLDGHPSVAMVPALLALAEARDLDGRHLLTAYIAGLETEIRLARLSHPAHIDRGWHPTATLGVLGCAAACARLLSLDEGATSTALAIAASNASGLRANSGTMTKPLHAAMANRNGLQAALLAERGFTANRTALEHKFGYLAAYHGGTAALAESALADWDEVYTILSPGIAIKQYPCCAFIHSAIDAAAEIRTRGLHIEDIETVRVHLHGRRLHNIDRPQPKDGLDARFSTQYLTARSLQSGTVTFADFDLPALADEETKMLSRRVELVAHNHEDFSFGHVEAFMRTGECHEASASVAMGRDPVNPMTDAQFFAKFSDCAAPVLDCARAGKVYRMLTSLEIVGSIRDLTRMLEPVIAARKVGVAQY